VLPPDTDPDFRLGLAWRNSVAALERIESLESGFIRQTNRLRDRLEKIRETNRIRTTLPPDSPRPTAPERQPIVICAPNPAP
jgi:hypothetical protein